jgi:fucose permease
MIEFALLGAAALWLLYGWLLAAIISSYLSDRKGYGEKPGLACGLLLYPIGVIMWLVWPAREESKWKQIGPFGRGKSQLRRPD